MRNFHCGNCGHAVFFENALCERCRSTLAYLPDKSEVAALASDDDGLFIPIGNQARERYRRCGNATQYGVCNWAVPADDPMPLCLSCRLNSVIPNLSRPENRFAWNKIEAAKRRMVYGLSSLGLPLHNRMDDPTHGLVFKFMSDSSGKRVMTGHDEGVITLNIDEADDVIRERRRISMREPYRTLLGHFRHEIGHYYWDLLIKNTSRLEDCRSLFGNDELDYAGALENHYSNGPRADWQEQFVSSYASVHPWEDWAETWAHYMHMTDSLETAGCCGFELRPIRDDEPHLGPLTCSAVREMRFEEIIGNWLPLTYALNNLNRGMGLGDAYPFVLPPAAIEKLRFVHETICAVEAAIL